MQIPRNHFLLGSNQNINYIYDKTGSHLKADNQNTTVSCRIDISYGLTIAGINGDYDTYLNKYTSKELQTGEFDPMVSTGLEMLDFGSRFYDPQLGRWHTPDPAEQFANPYLAMGTTKREESFRWKDLASGEPVALAVVYVDPDGEIAFIVPIIVGAVISTATYTAFVAMSDGGFNNWNWGQFGLSVGIGALSGGVSAGIGAGIGVFSGGIKQSKLDRQNANFNLNGLDLTASMKEDFIIGTSIPDPTSGNDLEDFKAILASYKRAVQGTKIGADGFPNVIKMEEVVNVDAIKQSNYWRRNNWSPGVYSRNLKIDGAKITMQYTFVNYDIVDVTVNRQWASVYMQGFDGSYFKPTASLKFYKTGDLFYRSASYMHGIIPYFDFYGPVHYPYKH